MPFDAQLAIAALDFNGFGYSDHPDLSVLRARYPELGFVFDRLEDLQETADTVHTQVAEAVDYAVNPLSEQITELEQRNNDLCLALNQIRELTDWAITGQGIAEITQIIEDAL
jgi:tetrahydromethanopterin S-methyltransferase subunit B